MKTKRLFLLTALAIFLYTTVHSQTTWVKHSGNPVVPAQNGYAAEPAVIFNSPLQQYQMWYTVLLDGKHHIYYATSSNGLDWFNSVNNPVLSPGASGAWDDSHVRSSAVIYQNGQYLLYYFGSKGAGFSIGLAISNDGINWQKYSGNPIISPGGTGTWDEATIYHPKVLFDGTKFFLWYAGSNGTDVKGGLAISVDGLSWTKHPQNPVLLPGAPGSWDEKSVWPSSGVALKNGKFTMLYTGVNFANPTNSPIGLAFSDDGIIWQKSVDNPVLLPGPTGSWDHEGLGNASLMRDNDRFKLWYGAHDGDGAWHIGYAESAADDQDNYALSFDGINDIVRLPRNSISTPVSITMEVWIKYSSSQTHMQAFSIEGAYAFFLNRTATGTFTPFFDGSTNNGNDFGYGTNLNDNKWHHLAAAHAQGKTQIFIDGVLVGSINESLYDINSLDRAVAIGAQFDGSEFLFVGLVDEVRVWNLARSAGEIQADMFRRLTGNESGLIGYWRCDEGEGQIVHDASPSGNDGQFGSSSLDDAADPQWVLANRINTDFECFPLPAAEAYGNINAGNRSHPDMVAYCFSGRADDWYLSFEAYDIDTNQEVDILLNGVKIFDSPLTANNSWSGLLGVLLPDELIHNNTDNELFFDNIHNPPQSLIWGVRRVSVDPFYALPSMPAYGKIPGGDQNHADKVVYFFSGRSGDLNLYYEVFDIDNVNELDVLLNGAKVHDETPTADNTWSRPRTLLLPDALVNDAGINVLIFDSPSNPPHQWYWGVRKVQVGATQNSSVALELSQSRIVEANMARDGQYLFDGRRMPPARLETDDDAAIDGATTIAPNGYLVVDLQTVRQFDYLQLYPEWNAQRYFTYRVEASQNGKDWQTVIDKSASFVHGIQLDELPTTPARFLRISGASFMADVDALPTAELSEEAYWQTHDVLVNRADSTDLAIAELALLQKQSQVNVVSDASSLPASYDLAQNFPNPFNPVTTIEFALPRPAKVKLVVYDLRGAIVRILEEGELPAGFHTRTFDTAGLASGVYLYQLQAGEFTATRKMILAK